LSGQYLYDYVGDPGLGVSRRLPCSDFTVRRHRTEGYAVDIECRGRVLEPEMIAPPFGGAVWREGSVPEDRALVSDGQFATVKLQRMRGAG